MKRQQFNDEFKREAVRLASQLRISKTGVSKDLGINANMLRPLDAGAGRRFREELLKQKTRLCLR
jgi:transposase-like protein